MYMKERFYSFTWFYTPNLGIFDSSIFYLPQPADPTPVGPLDPRQFSESVEYLQELGALDQCGAPGE